MRQAAIKPSRTTPVTAARTKIDWSNNSVITMPGGAMARAAGRTSFLIRSIISRVEALPFLITVSKAERCPSERTTFCCWRKPSRTEATSRTNRICPSAARTGASPMPAMVSKPAFMRTAYSVSPILVVPDGKVRFCAVIAFITSAGVTPLASNEAGSRSTMIWRGLPPYGTGIVAPCTCASS